MSYGRNTERPFKNILFLSHPFFSIETGSNYFANVTLYIVVFLSLTSTEPLINSLISHERVRSYNNVEFVSVVQVLISFLTIIMSYTYKRGWCLEKV